MMSSTSPPAPSRRPSERKSRRGGAGPSLIGALLVALLGVILIAPPTIAHDAGAQLLVSAQADRSGASPLSGASLSGEVYIFLAPEAEVSVAEFWLDDEALSGTPRQRDTQAPFDFAGGTSAAAVPFDTAGLTEGAHVISTRVTMADGHVSVLQTNFTKGTTEPAPAAAQTLRINAGGGAVTTGGLQWEADQYFLGGKSYTNSRVTTISGTTDDALYLTERSATSNLGSFGYAIPAAVAGTYTITLHFAEIYHGATGGGPGGAGKRVFSVNAEGGSSELTGYDIFAEVGAMAATTRTISAQVADGTLNLDFAATVDQPKVSALEITGPGTTSPTTPPPSGEVQVLRVNAGGPAVTTGGVQWLADQYFVGGKSYTNPKVTAIAGTTDDALHLTERSATSNLGSFAYAIPAATSGSYSVKLHFAEIYHGATGGGPGGAGKRVMSVNAEGGAVELAGFDILAEVPAMTAITKTVTAEVDDGTLDLAFTATVDQPKISAIEVTGPATGSTTPPPSSGDPSAFSWETKPNAPIGRSEAQGAAVDGKIYVFGGFSSGWTTTARSDVFDTVTNTWSKLPDMPEELTHAAVVVDGTTIWLLGGYVGDHPGPTTSNVWKFDTVARTWSRGPALPAPRGAGGAAIVERQLYFFSGTSRVAGSTEDPDQADTWALNLDSGTTWTAKAPLPNARNHVAAASVDGKVYAIGGQHNENESSGLQSDVHSYDPVTNAWQKVASLPVARSHAVAEVRDGQIVLIGGTLPGDVPSSDVTSYSPAADVWAKMPSLPSGRKTPVIGVVDGSVWVTGGSHSVSTWVGRFQHRWEASGSMPVALGEVAGGTIGKTLYLIGEGDSSTLALDLSTGTWRTGLAVRPFTGHHHAAEVINGRLHLFGGLGAGAGKHQIYDPATDTWTLGPDMPFAAGSSASSLIGGKVYVAGGIVGSTTTSRAAVYDPAAGSWKEIAPMPQGRNHAAATTDGSRMFVAGGRGAGSGDDNIVANGFDSLQVYDPATDSWRSSAGGALAPLPQARGGMGKAVHYGGEVYVIGGETQDGAGATSRGVYNRVDIYNPATNTWRSGTPMLVAKHGLFPLLTGSRITVAGGGVQAGSSSSATVETYNP